MWREEMEKKLNFMLPSQLSSVSSPVARCCEMTRPLQWFFPGKMEF